MNTLIKRAALGVMFALLVPCLFAQTNIVAAPSSGTVSQVISLIPDSWIACLVTAIGAVWAFYQKVKGNKVTIALLKSVQAGRAYLASEHGQEALDGFTAVLASHQETAGVATAIDKLLDKHVVQLEPQPVKTPTQAQAANNLLPLVLLFALPVFLFGCGTPTLETGGAYAPAPIVSTNIVGIVSTNVVASSDLAFYAIDSAFDLAESTIEVAFKIERDNRALLWKASPQIKHALDSARPTVVKIIQDYTAARSGYIKNPSTDNLNTLSGILQKIQQVSSAVSAAMNQAPSLD